MPGTPSTRPRVAATPDHAVPGYDPRSRWWAVLRHGLAIAVTTAVVVMSFMVATLPFAAVFLLDDALPTGDYVEAVLTAGGVALAASVLVFPVAFGFERKVIRGGRVWKALGVCAPVASPLAAALVFASLIKIESAAAISDVFGLAMLYLMSFAVYWVVLWSLTAVHYGVWRLSRRIGAGRRLA
ncbi:hypothetical protein [Streptomyces sp. NRRL B-24484]|uniref:hypothetical protein n=1 Tax=Streptomyces sp. NRRL B-24484 TaxID=1463833 RepID=UPI0004C1F876|nr:hypothetical protein [Streptomyces sp. NRRL B-24484]